MGALKAGTGKAVITPPVGYTMGAWVLRKGKSTGVHDNLFAKALVLDDGKTKVAIVSLDTLGIKERIVAETRKKIRGLTSIKTGNVLLNCSHNHTAPRFSEKIYEKYWKLFPDIVAGAVYSACKNMRNASIGIGFSKVAGISSNRMHHERPFDKELGVVRIDDENSKVLACLVNFPCHALIAGGQYLQWTADFPGTLREFIENTYLGSSCLFLQGACGDINPWDWWFDNDKSLHEPTYDEANKFSEILGKETIKVMKTIKTEPDVLIKTASTKFHLQKRKVPHTLAEAKKLLKEILKENKPHSKDVWPERENIATLAQRYPENYSIAFAKRAVNLIKGEKKYHAEVQVIKINDIIFAANPGELFNELGLKIKSVNPGKTFVLGYSNGYAGYIPTREAVQECSRIPLKEGMDSRVCRWAYGAVWPTSWYSEEAGEKIVEETMKLIIKTSVDKGRK